MIDAASYITGLGYEDIIMLEDYQKAEDLTIGLVLALTAIPKAEIMAAAVTTHKHPPSPTIGETRRKMANRINNRERHAIYWYALQIVRLGANRKSPTTMRRLAPSCTSLVSEDAPKTPPSKRPACTAHVSANGKKRP